MEQQHKNLIYFLLKDQLTVGAFISRILKSLINLFLIHTIHPRKRTLNNNKKPIYFIHSRIRKPKITLISLHKYIHLGLLYENKRDL